MNTKFSLIHINAARSAATLVAVALAVSAIQPSATGSTANVSTNNISGTTTHREILSVARLAL